MRSRAHLVYWKYSFKTSVYLINNPYELLFHFKSKCSYLKTFGCLCFSFLKLFNHKKLEPRSLLFLGYATQHKGYWCLKPMSKHVYVSTHVKFDETTFPFLNLSSSDSSHLYESPSSTTIFVSIPFGFIPKEIYNHFSCSST